MCVRTAFQEGEKHCSVVVENLILLNSCLPYLLSVAKSNDRKKFSWNIAAKNML